MIITKLEQIECINLSENKIFYIYGKAGSGKTYFTKQIVKKNNETVFYTDFNEIVKNYAENQNIIIKNKEVIIIDDEIKTILEKEFMSLTLKRILEKLQNEGKKIIIISNLTPKQLKSKNKILADCLLNGEKIEICYDIENRMKIAEQYSKQCKTIINKNIIKSIAKEENLGKMKGQINQFKIIKENF